MTGPYVMTRARLAPTGSGTRPLVPLLLKAAAVDAGHALIWSLFPTDQTERPFLYREMAKGEYLILSVIPPTDEAGLWVLESKTFEPDLSVGDRLNFSLRCDAAVNVPLGTGAKRERGRKTSLHARAQSEKRLAEDVAQDWLAARLGRAGANLEAAGLTVAFEVPSRIEGRGGGRASEIRPVLFEGRLTVTDPPLLMRLLYGGIGRSRAYGCGLILVRRV